MDLVDALECAFTYAYLHLSSLILIYMLVWCMLVVGLIDEMKNQHAQDDSQILGLFHKWYQSLAYNVDLTRYLALCLYKWYLTNDGAKDGIIGALRLVSHFKGPSLTPQHHLVDITLPQLQSIHMCKLSIQTLSTYVGEANATNMGS